MDYYEALGVSRNSEPEVIDAAYRALMKKYHPDLWKGDKAESEPRAQLINEAYATLRDEQRRRAYDKLYPADKPRIAKPPSMFGRSTSAKVAPNAWARQPMRRTTRSRRKNKAATVPASSRYSLSGSLTDPVVAICALVGVVAVIALLTQGSIRSRFPAAASVGPRPVAAAALGAGLRRSFCITNRTTSQVRYSLYWGGTAPRQYDVEPGYHVMHSSAYTADPLVKFFGEAGGGAAVNAVKPVATSGNPETCQVNYSFRHKAADPMRVPGDTRFGLFRDRPIELTADPQSV